MCVRNNTAKVNLTRVYIDRQGDGEHNSFIHYLTVTEFDEKNFELHSIVKALKNYCDTCTVYQPIGTICLVRQSAVDEFEEGEPNFDKVYEDAILELYFAKEETSISKFAIRKFVLFERGAQNEIDVNVIDSLLAN